MQDTNLEVMEMLSSRIVCLIKKIVSLEVISTGLLETKHLECIPQKNVALECLSPTHCSAQNK
jgi:hypothetical protein